MNWLDNILTPKTTDVKDFETIRKLRILNLLVISDLLSCIFHTIFGLFTGHVLLSRLSGIAALFLFFIYILIRLSKINLAICLIIIFGSTYVFLFVYYFADIGIEYYLISGTIALSFVFGNKAYTQLSLFCLLSTTLMLVQTFDKHFAPIISSHNQQVAEWVKYPNIIFSIFLIYMTVRQYYMDLERSLQIITAQNKDLADKNNQILFQKTSLEHANKTKNRILSILAHDLRGPIHNLKTTMFLLMNKALDEKERDKLLIQLHESSIHSSEFLEQLLLWGKNQFENTRINITRFDLTKLVCDVILLMNSQANMKSILITCSPDKELLIDSDRDLIHTSLRNLIYNAIKFTQETGQISVNLRQTEAWIIIDVKDNGTGISKEHLTKIFTSDIITKKGTIGEKGTGLGLMLVKDCIEKCKGKIDVDSSHGIGTTFTIYLPHQYV